MKLVFAILTALVAGFWAGEGFGQVEVEWEWTSFSEHKRHFHSVATDSEGQIVAAGVVELNGESDIYLVKTTDEGDVIWQKEYGGASHENCWAVCPSRDGGFLVVCQTWSYGREIGQRMPNGYLLKIDDNGDSLWCRLIEEYGFEFLEDAIELTNGNFICVGRTVRFPEEDDGTRPNTDLLVVCLNSEGEIIYTHTWGEELLDESGSAVVVTQEGNIVIAGNVEYFSGDEVTNSDVQLTCMDPEGNIVWEVIFGDDDLWYCGDILQTSDRGFLLVIEKSDPIDGNGELYFVKTDDSVSWVWSRSFDLPGFSGTSICETRDGEFVFTGSYDRLGNADRDIFIGMVDSNGDSLWTYTFGTDLPDGCDAIVRVSDDKFLISGYKYRGNVQNAYLAKFSIDIEGIVDATEFRPNDYQVLSAYPNPFNSTLNIGFVSLINLEATLRVTDALGREACLPQLIAANRSRVVWNAEGLPAGKYVIYLEAGDARTAKAVTLLK